MTTLTTVVLTILCICSAAELALLIFLFLSYKPTKHPFGSLLSDNANNSLTQFSTSAPGVTEEELARERRRYQEDLQAFQELMNYNADVAYGIDRGDLPKE